MEEPSGMARPGRRPACQRPCRRLCPTAQQVGLHWNQAAMGLASFQAVSVSPLHESQECKPCCDCGRTSANQIWQKSTSGGPALQGFQLGQCLCSVGSA